MLGGIFVGLILGLLFSIVLFIEFFKKFLISTFLLKKSSVWPEITRLLDEGYICLQKTDPAFVSRVYSKNWDKIYKIVNNCEFKID